MEFLSNSYVQGYLISCLLGAMVIFPVWKGMWRVVSTERTTLQVPDVLAIFQGITERAIYTSCVIFEVPEGIAAWLAFKAIQRVRIGEQTPDFKHVPGTAIYLIGNALSLAFGVAGGLVAIERFTLNF